MAGRGAGPCFNAATTALVQRKRLKIEYHGRTRGDVTNREISPQHLVHYRDNWYLDAWCHLRKALRSFALEVVGPSELRAMVAETLRAASSQYA